MAESDFERTEAPTPRRRQEARENGNVARSPDLTATISLLASFVLLYLFGLKLLSGMKRLVESMLSSSYAGNLARAEDIGAMAGFAARVGMDALAPLVLCGAAIAVLANICQVGFLVSTKPLEPNLTKLSPIRGAKNLVNKRAAIRLIMSLAKVGAIGIVATWFIMLDLDRIMMLSELEPLSMVRSVSQLVFSLAMKIAMVLLVLAILDYAFQYWQREQELKMTKEDVRQEMKRMEGDPLTKQRRSRVARQLALQRIAQTVPNTDVVVTNPTHFAVALQYDGQRMSAPKVVAKGADLIAMRIRQIALANEIPIVERKELARTLYRHVEVGQEVPPQFYNAVAEILAYVYRISGRRSA